MNKPHIVIDATDQHFKCLRCGDKMPAPFPCTAAMLVVVGTQYQKEHENCGDTLTNAEFLEAHQEGVKVPGCGCNDCFCQPSGTGEFDCHKCGRDLRHCNHD